MEAVNTKMPHRVVLEDCATLVASGVQAIISYDADSAVLAVSAGILTIGGTELCVSELNVQTGEIKVNGSIEYVHYTKRKEKKDTFFKRLTK